MAEIDLDAIARRLDRAHGGPYVRKWSGNTVMYSRDLSQENVALITHAYNDITALFSALAARDKRIEELALDRDALASKLAVEREHSATLTRERDEAREAIASVANLAKQVVQLNGEWMPDSSTWILTISDSPGPHFLTGAQIRELAAALDAYRRR